MGRKVCLGWLHAICLLVVGENPAKGFRGVGEKLIGVKMKKFGP